MKEAILKQSLLIKYMTQSSSFIVYTFAASLTHVLFAVCAISKGIFFFAFGAQHSSFMNLS